MRVDMLYFGGCPNWREARKLVQEVLAQEGVKADVTEVEVPTPEEAERLGFLGSPTIRVDGDDVETGRSGDPPFWGCRTYLVGGQAAGLPPREWVVRAIRQAKA